MNGKNLVQRLNNIKQRIETFRNELVFYQGKLGQILETIKKEFGFEPEKEAVQEVLDQMEKSIKQTEIKLESLLVRFENKFKKLESQLNNNGK